MAELSGYPDAATAPSVVMCAKQSLTVNSGGLADGWGFSLVVWPWVVAANNMSSYSNPGGNVLSLPGTGAGITLPQVSVYTSATGSNYPYVNPGTGTPQFGLNLPDTITTGRGRLIGMGVEIANTTAELYKGGSLLCYRQAGLPGPPEGFAWLNGGTGAPQRLKSLSFVETPPTTLAAAMLIPGSRQWKAADGAYIVIPFQSVENPPNQLNNVSPYMTSTEPDIQGAETVFTCFGTSNDNRMRVAPINQSGIMVSGLTTQSTFLVNVVWYYERFPDPEDSELITLAKPSCAYDPKALKLYTEVLNSLPVAVPFNWNAAGDWWWDVVSAIREGATAAGTALGGIPGGLLGAAVGQAVGYVQDTYMTAPGQKAPKNSKGKGARKSNTLNRPKLTQPQRAQQVAAVPKSKKKPLPPLPSDKAKVLVVENPTKGQVRAARAQATRGRR